ncbi:MAG: multidrug efflux transporter [Cryobacterium sp.]|nr:multidrug efflux transporter [Cryobacterium sp.]
MSWLILLASSVLEAVWASALGASDGFREPVPVVIFVGAMTLSMLGLGFALREIPLGTAYAVWTGLGAALAVAYSMLTGLESASLPKILFLSGIIFCAMGLKVFDQSGSRRDDASVREREIRGCSAQPEPTHLDDIGL